MTANPYGQRNDGGWCTCADCGRTFGGLTGFDRHRIATSGQPGYDPECDWRCATDEELGAAGLTLTDRGVWSREAPFRLTPRRGELGSAAPGTPPTYPQALGAVPGGAPP